MHAIFGFAGNQLVDWDGHALKQFPLTGQHLSLGRRFRIVLPSR